jgi:hypothetical protein
MVIVFNPGADGVQAVEFCTMKFCTKEFRVTTMLLRKSMTAAFATLATFTTV